MSNDFLLYCDNSVSYSIIDIIDLSLL